MWDKFVCLISWDDDDLDLKITVCDDMGKILQWEELIFRQNVYVFNIFVYVNNSWPLIIQEM